jgi:5S rRNA maturation endonuclease (ribonuclease M5)
VQKKQKNFVSDDEIANASKVHIVDFMIANGEPIERTGSSYFKHKNHDSLVLNTNGQWYWNSESIGGHGSISLARKFYDIGFVDAVNKINGMEITKQFENEIQEEKKPFVYPKEYETNTIDNAMKYLSEERMLDPKIVLALKKHDLIAEDKMKNIFFKWKDREGIIVGGDRQGTQKMENKRGTFKQLMPNSKGDAGFKLDVGKPDKIAFFESPIDALSYFDLKRPQNIRLQSLSGLKVQTMLTSLREFAVDTKNQSDVKVILAVDNDKAGQEFIEKWKPYMDSNDSWEIDKSKNKDWNDDLKEAKQAELIKQPFSKNKELNHSVEVER